MRFLKYIFSIGFLISLLACESGYKYEIIEINGNTGVIQLLSDKFVIDSINIGRTNDSYYSATLIDKGRGSSVLNINDTTFRNYKVEKKNMDLMCVDTTFDYNNYMDIVIRSKSYSAKNLFVDRDSVQRFNTAAMPCRGKILRLEAITRH